MRAALGCNSYLAPLLLVHFFMVIGKCTLIPKFVLRKLIGNTGINLSPKLSGSKLGAITKSALEHLYLESKIDLVCQK